jgi:hypothetical protein
LLEKVTAGPPYRRLTSRQISLLRELVEPNALLTSAERSYALSLMGNVTPVETDRFG